MSCFLVLFSGCDFVRSFLDKEPSPSTVMQLPPGYKIEKVIGGLTFPTGIAWDNQGRMYVSEAGGGFLSEPSPARIVRIDGGNMTEVINLEARGVVAPVVGFTWHNGAFYISHRAQDFTGAVSRVAGDGSSVNQILIGFIDSQAEHPLNDVRMGPDGRMYLATGPARCTDYRRPGPGVARQKL
jgi:sugar lactone lactonase YvrE